MYVCAGLGEHTIHAQALLLLAVMLGIHSLQAQQNPSCHAEASVNSNRAVMFVRQCVLPLKHDR